MSDPDAESSVSRRPGHAGAIREMLTPALGMLLLFQVFSGILVAPLLTLFPVYVERKLGLPPVFSANVRILSGIAGGITALFGGAICDRLGRKPAYLLAMTGVVAAGLLFLVPRPELIYLLAVYAGFMFGLGAVAGFAYVMETSPKHSLALATGSFFLMGTLGNAVGSAASGWVARELPGGYPLLGWTMTAGHLLLMLAAWRLLPPLPRPEPGQDGGAATGYGALLRRSEIWCLLGLRFLPTVYWGAVTFLMPLLLFRLSGSEKPPGFYTGASLLVSAACQVAAGRLVDRAGVRGPVVVAMALVAVASLGQALLTGSAWALMLFGLLGAGAAWSLSVTMTTLVRELSSEETRARLLGLAHLAWSGGFLSGTLASGYLARSTGLGLAPLAFLISTLCCAGGVLCAIVIVRRLPARP